MNVASINIGIVDLHSLNFIYIDTHLLKNINRQFIVLFYDSK